MIELAAAESAPLPLPERLRGYSLARSLDAIEPMTASLFHKSSRP